jgi:O-antigen/teichoic acid export membrane protein
MEGAVAVEPKISRTRRFLHGVWLGYTNQALMMLGGIWLTPFLLHRIGQHDYGLWLVGAQLLMYLTLLDIGVVALVPRETAYATGKAGSAEQATDLPLMVGQIVRVVLYQMPLVLLAVGVAWWALPREWYGFRGAIGLTLIAFVLTFPLRIFQALLQGLQDFHFLGHTQIVTWIVSTAVLVVLVLKGSGFYALAAGWIITQVLSAGFAIYRVKRRFPTILPRRLPKLPWSALSSYLSRGFWISLSQIEALLLGGADILIIGKLNGAAAVVPYTCTKKLVSVLSNQPNVAMQAASPGLSELKSAGSRPRMFQAITALTQGLLLLSGLVACVVLAVNHSFVSWWVGPAQYSGLLMTGLMVLDMMLRHWRTTAVYSIFCFGYERRISIGTLLDSCLSAGASLLFVWKLGPIGAPMGSILGVCLIGLPVNLEALTREVGVSFLGLLSPLWPWFWRMAIISAAALAVGWRFTSMQFLGLATTSSLIGLIYLAVMFGPGQPNSALASYVRPRLDVLWKRLSWARPVVEP